MSVLNSCDLPTDPGPLPRTLIETEYQPRLNVFGVLRADGVKGSSFIHVQKTLATEEMYEGGEIFDTTAVVRVTDTQTGNVFQFEMIADTTHRGYYYNFEFIPECGHRYHLEVCSDILPTLTAETVVPVQPEIVPQSLTVTTAELRFRLRTTMDTDQYCCVLFSGEAYAEKEIVNENGGEIPVAFDLSGMGAAPTRLIIFGFDHNLTAYRNSTPLFIPQTYHEMVLSVENGFGCFGSLAVTEIGL
ncbi:MAG: DUF4249 family protein [Fidelibacterota bacterium]